jgi:NitT/TauT family transport system substrate-binding protein
MRLTKAGKVGVGLLLACGIGVAAYELWRPSQDSNMTGGVLGRPLKVGVVTWPGYAGGIVANGGFKPNKECIYWTRHNLLVQFLMMEDVDARAKAFSNGGVDVVWSTVDFWANELPGFRKGGVDAKAIMQVDWSRGGDAIVADQSIRKIEDLRGKKISLALFTPSHWLLEYNLENSSLGELEQTEIVKGLVGKSASPDARADFVAGKVDAAVVWEPDVTEALSKRANSHVLVSSKTAANLIADLMVARQDFIRQHPDAIRAFIDGWFDGTEAANRRPEQAAKVLTENESLYKDMGQEETLKQLPSVHWADLGDNTEMFGLDGHEPLFDRIFSTASRAWVKRGYIAQSVSPADAKDDSFLRNMYNAASSKPVAPGPLVTHQAPQQVCLDAISTKPINIYFPTGSAQLDANARQIVDQVATTAKTMSNAYICIEGNTDKVGSIAANEQLSLRRAEATVDYLTSQYGLGKPQFVSKGNGPRNPVCQEDTQDCFARNRRTDIKVVPASRQGSS